MRDRLRLSTRQWEAIPAPAPTLIEPWRWIDPDDLWAALPLLPPPYAEVVRLYWQEQLSFADIAHRLRIPISTVGARLYRGKVRLRQILRDRLSPDR